MNVEELQDRVGSLQDKVERLESKVEGLQQVIEAQYIENVEAINRLMEAVKVTNERLDFQRDRLFKSEEDIFLLKRRS